MLCVALPVTVGLVFRWVGSLTGRPMLGAEVREGVGGRGARGAGSARENGRWRQSFKFSRIGNNAACQVQYVHVLCSIVSTFLFFMSLATGWRDFCVPCNYR